MSVIYDEGLYQGKVVRHGLSKASTGTPQFYLTVKVMASPGYERTIYRPITDKTMPFLVEMLDQLEFKGSALSQLNPSHSHHVSLVGRTIELWCKHEADQNGVKRERWNLSQQRSTTHTDIQPITAADAKALDSLFKQAKALKGRQIDDGTYITDKDIPF